MDTVILDIETNGLNPDTIWCIVCKKVGSKETEVFTHSGKFGYKPLEDFREYAKGDFRFVAHNGLSFDFPVVTRLLQVDFDCTNVVDTFVVSRLVNYSRFRTHGLAEIGMSLGEPKSFFNEWDNFSQEMIDYCIQDVVVNEKVYNLYERFINSEDWKEAIQLEQDTVLVNNEMSTNGFLFDQEKASLLLSSILSRMSILEQLFQEVWPPELTEVNRIKYRTKADGVLFKNVTDAMDKYPKTTIEGSELVCFDYKSFNPGSPKDRIEKLWEANWEPVEKTKTHNEFLRDAGPGKKWRKSTLTKDEYYSKLDHFRYYGFVVNETNLLTLPEDAPEGASRLAEWLTLEGRRSSLQEWLNCVSEDSRIRGKFWNIGAWTHRMSHSSPNQANIFSPFRSPTDKTEGKREPRNAVEQVKDDYDYDLRALWKTDKVLVGTDADGIQLRLLAHYMQSESYTQAILEGKKEDETDIHNLNKRALGLNHLVRDDAKTFNVK